MFSTFLARPYPTAEGLFFLRQLERSSLESQRLQMSTKSFEISFNSKTRDLGKNILVQADLFP